MIKTKSEAVKLLVFHGVPQNLAKSSVDQAYQGAPEGSDLMYGWDTNCTSRAQPVEMTADAVWLMHEIIGDSLSFVKGGIAVFDDLIYDMNGDRL